MTQLILTEKPSVAKNIADALQIKNKNDGYFEGKGYVITWAFGHLLELYDAKDYDSKMSRWKMDYFPFIPSSFKYKVKLSRDRTKADFGAKKQLKIIDQLLKREDVNQVVSACDYDREGQIIGDIIISSLHNKKSVFRLLLNEWTPEEVLNGLKRIKPNQDMQPLQDAGLCRQWADWMIGINLTSVATLKYQKGSGKALNIGRVLLPTLKIIYDRDQAIRNFIPEDYYMLHATFKTKDGATYEGKYVEGKTDQFKTKEELQRIQYALTGQMGYVSEKKVEQKKEYPPYLFNLSNLQGYITNKYKGWTSDKVLKVAQSLYEKKYITYPRTASVVLEESLAGKTAKVLDIMKKGLPYEDEIQFMKTKRIFNNDKVESHSAIIPTYLLPKSLSKDETLVYQAIKNRFIMQFMPLAEHEDTKITTKVNEENIKGYFISKGKVQKVMGWKKVENMDLKDTILPQVVQHELVHVVDEKVSSHVTQPPKYHTEKTLLKLMETCGKGQASEDSEELMVATLSGYSIGTPATRAETIKKLKDVGYITAKGKSLTCTSLGRKLVETFPIQSLFDLEFTGRLEKALADIEKQKFTKEKFLQFIYQFTTNAVETIKTDQPEIIQEVVNKNVSKEVLGKCPLCGGPVFEGYKGFGCSNWKKGCSFVIWKNDKYLASMKKKPTAAMVRMLLKNGEVWVRGLTSRKGQKFNAHLKYEKNKANNYFSWKMEFKNK